MLRRVAVRVAVAEAEIVRARMLALAPAGFEEVEVGSELELAVYTDLEGEERIRAVFERASSSAVEPGWEERWRAFHRPVAQAASESARPGTKLPGAS